MRHSLLHAALLAIAATLPATPAVAQDDGDDIDHTFEFVTADGTIVPDGSVVTVTNAVTEDDGFGTLTTIMPSGLFVKNTEIDDASLLVAYTIGTLDSGNFQICFPTSCIYRSATGSYKTTGGTMRGSETRDLQTEWLPTAHGTCTATLQIVVCAQIGGRFDEIIDGPAVTLRFVYGDEAGVAASKPGIATPVSYYTLDGSRATALRRGIYLVRYSDGTVRKVRITG